MQGAIAAADAALREVPADEAERRTEFFAQLQRDAGLAQVEVYFRDRSGLPMFKGYVTDLDPRRLVGCESALRAHYCAKIAAGLQGRRTG